MLVISDTSPITNLIQIGELDLLKKLFDEIIIPKKVYQELADYEGQKREIDKREWIILKEVANTEAIRQMRKLLDPGEAEAILLAKELNADFLIIDERKGRQIAEDYGLRIIGLLGVLVRGKQKGHILYLKPTLDKLIDQAGFRVSAKLYDKILHEVGE